MNTKTYKEWWNSIDDYLAHMLMKEGYDHNKVYNIGVTELRAAGEEDKQMTMDEFVEFICRKTGIPYFDRNKIKRNLMKVNSSRRISSSQKGFENVAEGAKYDDYHIDTKGMGILSVENIIEEIEGRGNQAVLTVQTSDGSTNHSQFGSKDWKEYKDSVNNAGNAITDVWITEVEGGSYVRNSRRPIKSGYKISPLEWANRWIPEIYDQRKFIQLCEQKGISKIDSDEFFKLMDEFGFKSNGKTFEYDVSKYLYNSRKITSARYIATDPETGEVLGSADTYEEAVNEWGEDVTITDSEVGNGTDTTQGGILSSNKTIKSSISAAALEEQLDGQFWTRAEDFEDEVNEAGWDIEDVNNEYATISNDKGSQYEVRFYDHGEGRSFTMESFKCIYCDEDDDDEIESNYQFNQRIVNSVLTKEITEDDAIKQIASRNNMNIGFAKRIFNNLMEDKSLIQSGVMEMADDINKDFDLNGDLYSWFDDYVENDGKSTTVGGELVRAAHRIIERFENDGDKIGMGYGKETVNPAARYILAICNDYIDRNDIEEMLYNESRINYSDEDYEAWLQQFQRTFEDYLRDHEELFHAPNKNDMWNYKEDDDVDSSVTECCIYDDNGNEYWFQKDEDGWKCASIEFGTQPEHKVDETFSSGDDFESEINDRREPYGYFSKDGFTYNWEGVGEPDDEDEYSEWIITDVSLEDSLANVGETWQADDLGQYTVFDANGREINVSDLY